MKKPRKCSKCRLPGHTKRTCTGVSVEDLQKIVDLTGWGIEERFPETGFVYMGDSRRVFWKVEDGAPKSPAGLRGRNDIWINESWGCPTSGEAGLLYELVYIYVQLGRQGRLASLADKSPLHQLAVQAD